jgi:hypothetical protein
MAVANRKRAGTETGAGDAAIKFVQIDRYVEERLQRLRVKRAGAQLELPEAVYVKSARTV